MRAMAWFLTAAVCMVPAGGLLAAEAEATATFSREKGDNPHPNRGHEYSATVVIPKEFARAHNVKVAVNPQKTLDRCWIQSATFVGAGKQTRTVFVGTKPLVQEKYNLLLLAYPRAKADEVPKEGPVLIEDLEKKGFEKIDEIEVERVQ